jgi:predicted nucleic acid-binding protein
MTGKIFIDTSGFFAILAKRDNMHSKAADVFRKAKEQNGRFVTTDYVLDETATLLRARGLGDLAPRFFEIVMAASICRIEWMDQELFSSTVAFFNKHDDQDWSFTDCFSFIIMKQLRLSEALTKDGHFTAAGFVPLLV